MSSALELIPPIHRKRTDTIPAKTIGLIDNVRQNKMLFLFLLPGLVYFIVFQYIPLGGLIIAFKDYKMGKGLLGSDWVGLEHFLRLFSTSKFYEVFGNTLIINFYKTIFYFPVPIIISLLLNEIRFNRFKRLV